MTYIREIQGLRAVAALLVAIYHIWFNRVSGGVDAFFVIAAFFMMASFVRIGTPGGRDVLRYYGATVRRVVPLAAVVILATVAGTLLFIPAIYWREFAFHGLASAVFVENWWLAWTGTDYLRLGLAVSPFQQMWALSLQMQYYLVLPLLLWIAAAFAARRGTSVRRAWGGLVVALMVASFAYNLWITDRNQPWAYFDSLARGWEYMLGAALALNIDRLPTIPRRAARVLGYACLAVLVTFAAVIPVGKSFPGVAALIPVMSTLGLIVAARSGADIAALTNRPVMAAGEISFSFYLWHWPLLVFWRSWTGTPEVGILPGLGIMALAGLLAWGTLRLFEAPVRRWPPLVARPVASIALGVVVMLPVLGAIYAWADANRAAIATAYARKAAFDRDPLNWAGHGGFVPDPLIARADVARAYADGCHQTITDPAVIECVYGVRDGAHTVVLAGGSHSLQWLPALQDLAPALDLRIVSVTKSSCVFLDARDPARVARAGAEFNLLDPDSCAAWNTAVLARVMALRPDLILTIATRGRGPDEAVPEIYRSLWAGLTGRGIKVLALRDNPWFPDDVADCVARHADDPAACDARRADLLNARDPAAGLAMPGLRFADFSDLICDDARCRATVGGLLVYRDEHHLTGSFVRAHGDRLGREIEAVIGRG